MTDQKGFIRFSEGEQLLPREEILELEQQKINFSIGVPKEVAFQECRIPLVPQAVGLLIANGHKVYIESSAGEPAHFSNAEFSEAGATIVKAKEEVFKSDIVLKVAPPVASEIDMFKSRQTLISSLQLPSQGRDYFEKLMSKKITALAFEYIRDKTGAFPLLRAMSEMVGSTSILIAAEYLQNPKYGKGTLLGGFPGITPSEVVILGAGTVAEYIARAALGLGAVVKIFDNSIYKLRRIQDILGSRVFTSIIQPKVLLKALRTADVAIGAVHTEEGVTETIVSEDMVRQMKYGAVIVDVSIDQGGCFETSRMTTHKSPVYEKHDVTHYCVPNIASRVPHTASYALSNFFTPVLLKMGDRGGMDKMLKTDFGLRKGAYLFKGTLTKPYIGSYFTLPFQDIELLMAAYR